MRVSFICCIALFLSGCSLFRGDVEPVPSTPTSIKDQDSSEESQSAFPVFGLELSSCHTEDCEPWALKAIQIQLCIVPLAVYQQTRPLGTKDKADGSEKRWAILMPPVDRPRSSKEAPPPDLLSAISASQERWRVIWEGVRSSEMLASAHAESVFMRTTIIPDSTQQVSLSRPCRDFTARRQQSARSFHRVDAREQEFDEDDIEDLVYQFDLKRGVYRLAAQKVQPQIKVRGH